ncbi:MAG: methyl-accepting chemotaxis protein [Methylococcales bacterium]
MKINMPVTDKEIFMKKGEILVTRTDLKGHITYANDTFVAISGFSRQELIGVNHNIVRHPDMPAECYTDLWQCLKELRPWTGMVKNRTKLGDFYWVDANVIPVFDKGKVDGYLSIRRMPKRERIEQAAALYKKINEKKAQIRPTGIKALVKTIKEIGVWQKTAIALTALLAPAMVFMYKLFLEHDFVLLAGVVLSVLLGAAVTVSLVKLFTDTLNSSIGIFYRLAEKRFGNVSDLTRKDLIGDFYRGLYSMEVNIGLDLAQANESATKSQRTVQALDKVHSGVMVTDNDFEIIYLNSSVQQLFKNAEHDIRKDVPHFAADKLLGANIDGFHKNPLHQRSILANLSSQMTSDLSLGGRSIRLVVNPVTDEQGARTGFVAEWLDRTPEVQIEKEIESLVSGIKAGDLSKRINVSQQHGFFGVLSSGINELTDVIERAFTEINNVMETMAAGDLTSSVNNDYQGVYDECKTSINDTMAKISEFIIQIRDAAAFIENSSQEMASGNNNLSHRAEQQAANLEETAASMEELTSTVKNTADNAQRANDVVNSARQVAERGGDVVNSAIAAMQEINDSSNKIADIISVIDEIAFQTNLLALNASVEAARAGEQGRGFSVVATEVRNLAQRSANAAKQSSELIQNSVQKVRIGTTFVNQTGAALQEIVSSVAQVGDIVGQIAAASAEQSAGIEQVNQAIGQLDDITQQNAALAEQAAAGSIAMSEQSSNMSNLISFFKVHTNSNAKSGKPVTAYKASAPMKSAAPSKPSVAKSVPKEQQGSGNEWEEF